MLRSILTLALVGAALHAGPPQIKGAVAKPGAAALKGLPQVRRLVKIAGADGAYRATMEVEGVSLKALLARHTLKKQDDGFNRPLDTYVVVRGKGGKALFSYGETFFTSDEGPLLVERARLILPGHHQPTPPPVPKGKPDPTILLGVDQRAKVDLTSCAACHKGPKPPVLAPPRGWLLISPQDGFGGRFVEDVTDIEIAQVGTTVKDTRATSKQAFVDSPAIIGPDGNTSPLTLDRLQAQPRTRFTDAAFGEGRGFHGLNTWEGVSLEPLVRPLLPKGVDPRQTCVVVTAEDGYRAVYSGSEVFAAAPERSVMLVDRKNGQPLGPGAGRLTALSRTDFYIDRDVRMVKEIRLITPK